MRRLIEDHGPIRVRDCLATAYRGIWLVFQQGVSDASDGAPLLAWAIRRAIGDRLSAATTQLA